jgi:uncharacterized protein (TIGR02147 family)
MRSIFDYRSYKSFVQDWVKSSPTGSRGQYRRFAEALRMHTTTVSQIFQGEKDLTLEQAKEATEYFGLSKFEARYFMTLVQHDRAGSASLRAYFNEEAEALRAQSKEIKNRVVKGKSLSEAERAEFYSQWYYTAISLLTGVEGFQTPETIAQATGLSLKRVRQVLQFLAKAGLCVEENGRYSPGQMRTHVEKDSPLAARHHANWRLRAIESYEGMGSEELGFTAPVTLSLEDAREVQALLLQLIENVSKIVAPSPSEELYVLNLDWLRVTRRP